MKKLSSILLILLYVSCKPNEYELIEFEIDKEIHKMALEYEYKLNDLSHSIDSIIEYPYHLYLERKLELIHTSLKGSSGYSEHLKHRIAKEKDSLTLIYDEVKEDETIYKAFVKVLDLTNNKSAQREYYFNDEIKLLD